MIEAANWPVIVMRELTCSVVVTTFAELLAILACSDTSTPVCL